MKTIIDILIASLGFVVTSAACWLFSVVVLNTWLALTFGVPPQDSLPVAKVLALGLGPAFGAHVMIGLSENA